jgi:hypothetical protein
VLHLFSAFLSVIIYINLIIFHFICCKRDKDWVVSSKDHSLVLVVFLEEVGPEVELAVVEGNLVLVSLTELRVLSTKAGGLSLVYGQVWDLSLDILLWDEEDWLVLEPLKLILHQFLI